MPFPYLLSKKPGENSMFLRFFSTKNHFWPTFNAEYLPIFVDSLTMVRTLERGITLIHSCSKNKSGKWTCLWSTVFIDLFLDLSDSSFKNTDQYGDIVTSYENGWFLFWYQWKRETHNCTLVAKIMVTVTL